MQNWSRVLRRLPAPILMILLCGFQTSFWFQIFGWLSAPPLWLLLIVYISLYRRSTTTVLWVYFLGFLASAFTLAPLKMIWCSLLLLYLLIVFVKARVFWGGPGYFALVSTASVATFQLTYWILSHLLEPNPVPMLPLERLTQILLTPLFSFPIHWLMSRLEPADNELSAEERSAT